MITLKTNIMKYKDSDGTMKDIGAIVAEQETDVSLTQSGVAADAKATGDAIGQLSDTIADFPTLVQTVGDNPNAVMSQKAVTDLVNDAIGNGGSGGSTTEYETVDSVEEMTDTTKQYVLSTTETLWAYREVTVEKAPENVFIPANATLNKRISSSGESSSNGMYITEYIEFDASTASSPIVWLPEGIDLSIGNQRVLYADADKNKLASPYILINKVSSDYLLIGEENGRYYVDISKIANDSDVSSYANTKYIRLGLSSGVTTAITADSLADIEILLEKDRGTTTEYQWIDTEIKPESAGSANLVEIILQTNANATAITEHANRLTKLETANGVVTIPTYWETAYSEAVEKVKAFQDEGGNNIVNFIHFSDLHYRPNNNYVKNIGVLSHALMEDCKIPFAVLSGDTMSAEVVTTEETLLEYLDGANDLLSPIGVDGLLHLRGNHDDVWNKYVNGDTTVSYVNKVSSSKIFNKIHRKQINDFRRVFGGDGTYFYVDTPQVRYVCLNSHYYNGNGVTNGTTGAMTTGFGTEQLNWLRDKALASEKPVIIATHIPPTAKTINGHTYYLSQLSDGTEFRSIITESTATIVCIICGHCHVDAIVTGDLKCPIITITCAINTPYDSTEEARVADSDKETALDIHSINLSTGAINITRLGVGNDRSTTFK